MASVEEKAEKARQESVEASATAERARELATRAAREAAAQTDESIVVHGPVSD